MIRVKLDKYEVFLMDSAFRVMEKYLQLSSKSNESGGILLGQVKENNIFIMKVTFPTHWDKSSRTTFQRNKDIAQTIINYEFYNSDKKTIYLGEWHTHPEKFPKPSSTDKKMIKDQYYENELNEPFLISLILGTNGLYIGLISENEYIGKNIDYCIE